MREPRASDDVLRRRLHVGAGALHCRSGAGFYRTEKRVRRSETARTEQREQRDPRHEQTLHAQLVANGNEICAIASLDGYTQRIGLNLDLNALWLKGWRTEVFKMLLERFSRTNESLYALIAAESSSRRH